MTSSTAFATSQGNASKFSTPFLLPSLSFSVDALVLNKPLDIRRVVIKAFLHIIWKFEISG